MFIDPTTRHAFITAQARKRCPLNLALDRDTGSARLERAIPLYPIWLATDQKVALATAVLQASLRKSGKTIEMPDVIRKGTTT